MSKFDEIIKVDLRKKVEMIKKFVLSIFIFVFSFNSKCQIYNTQIVYCFNYSIMKNGQSSKGKLLLACFGKLWPIKEQKQYSILWTTNEKEILEKIGSTGVIEEKNRVWLHPPRIGEFKMLEYSPFPEIVFPLIENQQWSRELSLSKYWENKEFNLKGTDVLKFLYEYRGSKKFRLIFNNEEVDCFDIYAASKNMESRTSFSGLYFKKYGFVKMKFENVDKSRILLELESVLSLDEAIKKINETGIFRNFYKQYY